MAYVSLLGDSIIDNKVYVQPNELSYLRMPLKNTQKTSTYKNITWHLYTTI